MNRCAPFLAALALAALAPAHAAQAIVGPILASPPASTATDGQSVQRKFPQNALRGVLVFGAPPAIQLNGLTGNLATGYRIHGLNNLLVMSAQLAGSTLIVDYTTDVQGAPFELWVLSPAEIAVQPWPYTRQQAATWAFDPVTQTWTKP